MIFEKEMLTFNILDVVELDQEKSRTVNHGRNFDALSFRFRAEGYMNAEDQICPITDNTVCFVPARVNYERVAEVDKMIVVHMDTVNYFSSRIEYFVSRDPEELSRLFCDILRCWQEKKTGYKYRCAALLYDIFAECYIQNFRDTACNPKIRRSVEYLNENFRDPDITVSRIAGESFISEVYFRKLFKADLGISPQKYIVKLRIQNAVGLMSTGYYSLKEVAYMSGYSDYKYFSTEFKRVKGVSPSEYLYNFGKRP